MWRLTTSLSVVCMGMQEAIAKVVDKKDLTLDEMRAVMELIMTGQATPAQIASFTTALRMKGETIAEITAAAMVMRDRATHITVRPPDRYEDAKGHTIVSDEVLLDTCGTGGDHSNTFNISTATALAAAAAGVRVAKHGNRAVSSACGSADVWEALGIPLDLSPDKVAACIEEIGIGFLYAPQLHGAMKHAIGPRREIGIRTFFNLLGPLTNPAGARVQLLGVYHKQLTHILAEVLGMMGSRRAMVVHGADGLDEITVTGPTYVSEWNRGTILNYGIHPEEFGIALSSPQELKGGDARENARIIVEVFKGRKGPPRDVVILNTAAALYMAEMVSTLAQGVSLASETIDQGKAMQKLNALVEWTNTRTHRNDSRKAGGVPAHPH